MSTMKKDVIKLLVLIFIVGLLIIGIYTVGKSVDNQAKYRHPITRPGAHW